MGERLKKPHRTGSRGLLLLRGWPHQVEVPEADHIRGWEQVHDILRAFAEECVSWEAERKLHTGVVVYTHPESSSNNTDFEEQDSVGHC